VADAPQLADYGISRRGLFKTGLAVGIGAAGLSLAGTGLTAGTANASQTATIDIFASYGDDAECIVQLDWAYCKNCRNLYYAPENGVCAVTNADHAAGSTTNYAPIINAEYWASLTPPGEGGCFMQNPWYWCRNCSCLFYGPDQSGSWCTVGAYGVPGSAQVNHITSGSGIYYMPGDSTGSNSSWGTLTGGTMQPDWRFCYNCKDLYFGGDWSESVCEYQLQRGPNNNNDGNGKGHAPGDTVYFVDMYS
jgi:hypothetical protein